MNIQTVDRHDRIILLVHDTITIASDLAQIRELVEQCLRQGRPNVGIRFDEKSHLYTHHISILAQCQTKLRAAGGSLALINPNDSIVEALRAVGLSGVIMIYSPED